MLKKSHQFFILSALLTGQKKKPLKIALVCYLSTYVAKVKIIFAKKKATKLVCKKSKLHVKSSTELICIIINVDTYQILEGSFDLIYA